METKNLSSFRASIRAAVKGIFDGSLDSMSGADAIFAAIRRGFTQAWYEGVKEYGIKPDELTAEELARLNEMIGDNNQWVGRFVDWINQTGANGGSLQSVFDRAEMWTSRYGEVLTVGREMAGLNQKEIWIIDGGEHCVDCLRLHGRVYRNRIWHKYGIHPQSSKLACFGGRCKCRRESTNLPITKGRPPNLVGPKHKEMHFSGNLLDYLRILDAPR